MHNPTFNVGVIKPNVLQTEKKTKKSWSLVGAIFKRLVLPYWVSEEKLVATGLLILAILLNSAHVYMAVQINHYNGLVFDSIQRMDSVQFYAMLWMLALFTLLFVLMFLAKEYVQDYLCFRWRSWMTKTFLAKWFHNKAFYKSLHPEQMLDNPDQRIGQDIGNFAFNTMTIGMTTINSFINAVLFAIVLWNLSPALSFAVGDSGTFTIPSYMLWFSLLFALVANFITYKIGKPMVNLDFIQEKNEANFRFGLMRIVDRKEEVALLNGDRDDMQVLNTKFKDIKDNYLSIIVRKFYINTAQQFLTNSTVVFPLLAAAPMLFAGTITLGALIQMTGAFQSLEFALLVFVYNFHNLASWKAMANRLDQFLDHTNITDFESGLEISFNEEVLEVKELELYKKKNADRLLNANFALAKGRKMLVQGASGIGKTTLVKTIAGIWPYAKGELKRPMNVEILPQKPYFPISTLRQVILYGNQQKNHQQAIIEQLLIDFNLDHLTTHLDQQDDWNSRLSLGEQQRLNFVRVVLIKPQWLIMDEPTASLDTASQHNAIKKLFLALKESTILTISHSQELHALHDEVIVLS